MHPLSITSCEKDTALIMGATGNLAFALAVVLKGLKKYNAALLSRSDIIIYYQNMDPATRTALAQIVPCRFIPYQFPHMQNLAEKPVKDYGEMTFVRYECFRYLKEYKYVMWLDADILICGDISGMCDQIPHGIGFRREYHDQRVRTNFSQDIPGFDMQAPHFNAGIMCLSQALTPDKDALADWCYQKTAEISPWLIFPDQGVLLLMCQHFGLTIDTLDEKYNCEAQRNRFALHKAVVIHAVGHRKFWKYYYFNEWFTFYKEWAKETGMVCQNNFPLLKKYNLLAYPLFQVAPNPAKYPIKFATYLFRHIWRARI